MALSNYYLQKTYSLFHTLDFYPTLMVYGDKDIRSILVAKIIGVSTLLH